MSEDEERKKFLESIKAPTKEEAGGEIDYANVIFNAKLQEKIFRKENEKKDKGQAK